MPVQIAIKLTPSAPKNEVRGWQDVNGEYTLKACVTAAPEKGKANTALLRMLAKEWGIPKHALRIVKGETARKKLLSVDDSCKGQIPAEAYIKIV